MLHPVAWLMGSPATGFNEKLIAGIAKVPTAPHAEDLLRCP